MVLIFKEACQKYPITSDPGAVFYTLNNVNGSFDKNILFQIFLIILIAIIATVFFTFSILFLHRYFKDVKLPHIETMLLFFSLSICIGCTYFVIDEIPIDKYLEIAKKSKLPLVQSKFYEKEYVTPQYENIIFPENKRNLIVILCESLESSFANKENGGLFEENLIPNLTQIASQNVNFSQNSIIGGGADVSGTGWTIAAMTAKFAGVPFNFSIGKENHSGLPIFLPNAVTLTDIFAKNGYNQRFIFGSDKSFGSRDTLLETHGNVEIHDIDWYKQNGFLDKNYEVFWGFEDQKLFEYAKYELTDMASLSKPFMFGLLTVDTHTPEGYDCALCENEFQDFQMKNVIRCSDQQIAEFVNWCQNQSWYENTTIVILGDHLFMLGEDKNFFGKSISVSQSEFENITSHKESYSVQNPRRWLDIFINPVNNFDSVNTKNRDFTSFDMFPTILSAMGVKISNNRLGLGVDLFSGEQTLIERYPEEELNRELMTNNTTYAYLEGRID